MIDAIFSNPTYAASKVLMDAAAQRQQAIASNIANVETPGYKRVDIAKSFDETFAAHLRAGEVSSLPEPTLEQDPNAVSTRMDGNNVQIDKELLAMSSNSVQYDTLTEFVSGNLKQLQMAISGNITA
jgi:flagellar basal-body rod protein FlgB